MVYSSLVLTENSSIPAKELKLVMYKLGVILIDTGQYMSEVGVIYIQVSYRLVQIKYDSFIV